MTRNFTSMILVFVLAHIWAASATGDPGIDVIRDAIAAHCNAAKCPAATRDLREAKISTNLTGSGFHRTLEYSVQFRCTAASAAPPAALKAGCRVALLQPLPAGLYANIYELENAASVGQGPQVRLFGTVDVESIEQYSQPTVLATYAPLHLIDGCATATATFPLHGRYPRPQMPSSQGWKAWVLSPLQTVRQAPPTLLVSCGDGGKWQQVQIASSEGVTWNLPTGNALHTAVASLATACAVLGAAWVVLHAALGVHHGSHSSHRMERTKRACSGSDM